MVKQNRAEDHSIYKVSTRIKLYGRKLTVVDVDTEEQVYMVSNRGVFSVYFELKACRYEGNRMIAPKVSIGSILASYYSVYPAFLAYYSEDFSYRVIPLNYAAVVYSKTRRTRTMTEEQFQAFFSSINPCAPEEPLNDISHAPTEFLYFYQGHKDLAYDIYKDGFDSIRENIAWYNGQNKYVEEAWQDLSNKVPEGVHAYLSGLWNEWKVEAKRIK